MTIVYGVLRLGSRSFLFSYWPKALLEKLRAGTASPSSCVILERLLLHWFRDISCWLSMNVMEWLSLLSACGARDFSSITPG
jgi:hypothetical protein